MKFFLIDSLYTLTLLRKESPVGTTYYYAIYNVCMLGIDAGINKFFFFADYYSYGSNNICDGIKYTKSASGQCIIEYSWLGGSI